MFFSRHFADYFTAKHGPFQDVLFCKNSKFEPFQEGCTALLTESRLLFTSKTKSVSLCVFLKPRINNWYLPWHSPLLPKQTKLKGYTQWYSCPRGEPLDTCRLCKEGKRRTGKKHEFALVTECWVLAEQGDFLSTVWAVDSTVLKAGMVCYPQFSPTALAAISRHTGYAHTDRTLSDRFHLEPPSRTY